MEQVGLGLVISIAASLVNLGVATVLMRAGRRSDSITLEADAHHLLTDVWTSAGVIVGVGLAWFTGWLWLDPLLALLVAANIIWTGVRLVSRSAAGLMDAALATDQQSALAAVMETHRRQGIDFHALWTRQAGARVFISVHVLVPGRWTVKEGHDLVERIEAGDLDGPETEALLRRYVGPLLAEGADTLVLGCTHYPFVASALRRIASAM